MDLNNMDIQHRIKEFVTIIANCVCTDFNQENHNLEYNMTSVMTHLQQLRANQGTLYIVGNGGSAAVASHALVDFVNVAKINAQVLHESSLLTCMANDFDFEHAFSRVLSQFLKPKDILIAISSSGKSKNICNAAKAARSRGALVITFTGFSPSNELRSLGDYNYWLNSTDYGYVEVGHQFLLHNLSDRFYMERQMIRENSQVEMV